MLNTYDPDKVDRSFEKSSRARESSKTRRAHRAVSSITINTIATRVKRESFFV